MEHHKVSIEDVAKVVNGMGLEAFLKLASQLPEVGAKYGQRLLGHAEAIFNMIEPADMDRLFAGEASIEIVKIIRKLVDKNGRIIPPAGMKSSVCDPNTSFKLAQPKIDYAERLNRLVRFFPGRTFLSAEEFQKRSEELLKQLRQDPILSNLLKGVFLPVCYPQFTIGDYGKDLEDVFLKAVADSYERQFPERKFNNYRKGELQKAVGIVEESHQRFIAKMAEGPMVGIQFFPLQGFSINADREIIPLLPKSLFLSGPVDFASTLTAYLDVMARDFNTPGCDCAAVSWRSPDCSLNFKAHDDGLGFRRADDLGRADDGCSAGLVFLG